MKDRLRDLGNEGLKDEVAIEDRTQGVRFVKACHAIGDPLGQLLQASSMKAKQVRGGERNFEERAGLAKLAGRRLGVADAGGARKSLWVEIAEVGEVESRFGSPSFIALVPLAEHFQIVVGGAFDQARVGVENPPTSDRDDGRFGSDDERLVPGGDHGAADEELGESRLAWIQGCVIEEPDGGHPLGGAQMKPDPAAVLEWPGSVGE